MKSFQQHELREAIAYAATGGQALHLHRMIPNRLTAPSCFVRAVDRGENIAHLFDQDAGRLEATVRRMGVRVVLIERKGQPSQHVDLCAGPLKAAVARCE